MAIETKPESSSTKNENEATIPETQLPSPADLPNADVVIFDGKCVFCRKSVRLLDWWVGKDRIAYVSLHDPYVAEHFPDLTHEQMMDQIYLVSRETNQKFGGAAAIRYLSTRAWKLWIAVPFLYFPGSMPLWQWLYMQVARNRYRIANRNGEPCDEDGTCKLHFDK